MTEKKTVVKIGTWYLVANIVEKAIAFFLLPVFTRLLTTEDYGIASTYLAYESIVSVIISLSLGNSLRGAVIDYKDDIDDYMSSVMVLQIIVAFVVGLSAILLSSLIIPKDYNVLVVMCLIHSFFGCITAEMSLKYMLQEDYINRTLIMILPNVISILLSILLIRIYKERPYFGRILGAFSVATLVGMFYTLRMLIRGRGKVNVDYWKYALRFSLPLVLHSLSLVVLNQIDRTMISTLVGFSETGIYSIAYTVGTIAIAITSAMDNVWTPWFYHRIENDEHSIINKAARFYTWTCVLLSFGVMFLSPEVMKRFTNKSYWAGIDVIPFLVAGTFFTAICTMPINLLYFRKNTKVIALGTIFGVVINLILNYITIPMYGASGAAFTTLVSHCAMFVLELFVSKKEDSRLFEIKTIIAAVVIVIMLIPVTMYLKEYPLVRWGSAAVVSVIYIIVVFKRNILKEIRWIS